MRIAIIAAMDKRRLIGNQNKLPWSLPADLAYFKATTLGKPIIMGRKTFESIGKALPGRRNIVITRDTQFQAPNCSIVNSPEEAIQTCKGEAEIMIIGGANIYQQFLPLAHRLYLTLIDHTFEGDTFFPAWDKAVWKEISSETHKADHKNNFSYRFLTLDK